MALIDWWNEQHDAMNKKYLTGTSLAQYEGIFGFHFKDKKVLEVGVGMGIAVLEMLKNNCEVDVLDISPIAIAKMPIRGFLTTDYDKIPRYYYDIITSFYVAQHMNNEDLLIQLDVLISALNQEGLLGLQYYETDYILPEKYLTEAQEKGGVPRSRTQMAEMISSCGGEIVSHNYNQDYKSAYLVIRRKRK